MNQRNWQFTQASLIKAHPWLSHFLIGETPVIVTGHGTYPELVNDQGESTRDAPHFIIGLSTLYTMPAGAECRLSYQGLTVTGHHQLGSD